MFQHFKLFEQHISMYAVLIIVGVLLANVAAIIYLKKRHISVNDFIAIEGYGLLGALIGSKALYLFVARDNIDWSRFFEPEYSQNIMNGGFVFFGGLIFAALFALAGGKIHKINTIKYFNEIAFCIPFAHAFGRLGCLSAGCCYGIPYDGPLAIRFSDSLFAPNNINLFPVQTFEAVLLFLLAIALFIYSYYMDKKERPKKTAVMYLFFYGIIRFCLEYLRNDNAERGFFGMFSTSQWISIGLIIFAIVWYFYMKGHSNNVSNADA